jgi:ribosomal protein S18 acetylase RimI-like enzyme
VTITGAPTGVVVRPAGVADAEALARVRIASWRGAYREIVPDAVLDGFEHGQDAVRWRERLAEPGPAWMRVGFTGEPPALAGFVTAGPGRHEGEAGLGEIWAIYVDPAAQGRGVGRALMDAAVRGLAVRGFGGAVLWVFEANSAARSFYEHLGWTPDGAAKAFEIGGAAPIELRYRRRLG